MKKIALIINPVAGLGGMAGLKGSDSVQKQQQALDCGYTSAVQEKAALALKQVIALKDSFELWTAPGKMGADAAIAAGFNPVVFGEEKVVTGRTDTVNHARFFARKGVDLIIFAGGDGTARDIYDVIGADVPALGIPAGVKMYSAVYAINPTATGIMLKDFVEGRLKNCAQKEVMDMDEQLLGQYGIVPTLRGYLSVPDDKRLLQKGKERTSICADEIAALADWVKSAMKCGEYCIFGPGSTIYGVMDKLGIGGSLLGVDVVLDGKIVCKDAHEKEIFSLLQSECAAKIFVTAIGGQGHIFGRGNQQISARIIRAAGKDAINILVTKEKMTSMELAPLLVDTGDSELDRMLSGYYEIRFSPFESAFYKVGCVL